MRSTMTFLIGLLLAFVFVPTAVQATTICAPAVLTGIQIREETAGYDIDIEYPVLCAPAASRTIRDYITKSLSDFKMNFPEHDLTDYRHKHQMLTEYQVWTTGSGRLASVKVQEMVFTGGAHPNNWPVTWVFDMTDGHALTLDDVFINKRDALIHVAEIVRTVLIPSLGQMYVQDMLDDGTTPVKDNYNDFILNDEGMVFFFAPYQVAPYASGQQVVTIPYDRLKDFLTPDIAAIVQ